MVATRWRAAGAVAGALVVCVGTVTAAAAVSTTDTRTVTIRRAVPGPEHTLRVGAVATRTAIRTVVKVKVRVKRVPVPGPTVTRYASSGVSRSHTRTAPQHVSAGGVWDRLAQCESGGDWAINTGNGFSGGLQFTPSTWAAYGGLNYASAAYLASREAQIAVATRVQASQGWAAWPSCSAQIGLR
jgi:hypothetical protein